MNRLKKKYVFRSLLNLLCIGMIISVTACQITPKSDIVISKNDGRLEAALASEEENDSMLVVYPERWEAEYEGVDGRVTVSIDADIFAEKKAYDVVKVEPYLVPIEQVDKIIEALFGTTEVYSLDDDVMTKSQIESFIIELKKAKAEAENNGDKDEVESYQMNIEELSAQLNLAPEEISIQPYDHAFIDAGEERSIEEKIIIKKDYSNVNAPYLYIFNTYKSNYISIPQSTANYIYKYRDTYFGVEDSDCLGTGFSNSVFNTAEAAEAIEVANTFLKQIGIENRVVSEIETLKENENSNEIIGYRMIYSRRYNDIFIPAYVQYGGVRPAYEKAGEEGYMVPYTFETLRIEVENGNVMLFQWSNISEPGDMIKENIALLPFGEIQKNIENQLTAKYAYLEEYDESLNIYINKIVLTYAVNPIKDRPNEYMMIPVWAFYGGDDYGDGQIMPNGITIKGRVKRSYPLLTVSAIDGSVIY